MKNNSLLRKFTVLPIEVQLLAIWTVVAAIGAAAVLITAMILDKYV
jgi:hypothetical protein